MLIIFRCCSVLSNENYWMLFISALIARSMFYKLIKSSPGQQKSDFSFFSFALFVCMDSDSHPILTIIIYSNRFLIFSLALSLIPITDTEARDMEVKHFTSATSSVFTSWRELKFLLNLKFSLFALHYIRLNLYC